MKKIIKIKNKSEKVRFAVFGAISTTIDFGLLFWLYSVGLSGVGANFISTFIAFCFSFIANKNYTFRASGHKIRQFTLYFIVTFVGIWGIQPIVIWITKTPLSIFISSNELILFTAKLLATGVTLIWNYFLYSRVVFPKPERD